MPQPTHDPYDDLYDDVPDARDGQAQVQEDEAQVQEDEAQAQEGGAQGQKAGAIGQATNDGGNGAAAAISTSTNAAVLSNDGAAKDSIKVKTSGDKKQPPAVAPSGAVSAGKGSLPPKDPYDDIYGDTEGEAQDNFVESKEPSELLMCLILASAYLGLAKYCWTPLLLAKDWKLLFNIEGFFICIAVLAILIGLRPYLTPSSLQVSKHGIKYRGPYWPQRKTVNWSSVIKLYLSPELIVVLHQPKQVATSRWRLWRLAPMIIPIIYLSDRERRAKVFIK
jgi:hypothetical protein